MNITELKKQLASLGKAEEAKKNTIQRAPFADWMESISYYKAMPEAQKERIRAEVDLWYEPEAIAERKAAYGRKLAQGDNAPAYFDAKEASIEACQGFAKVFGLPVNGLPFFQQDMLAMMCAIHIKAGLPYPLKMQMPRPFSASKGIFVAGAPQIGKTSVFVYLKRLPYFRYRIVTSEQLRSQTEKYGASVADNYAKGEVLVIDEVGWERPALSYGNKIDIVAEIIHARHAAGRITHMASNMTLEQLRERYDPHIVARIENTCNVLLAVGAKPVQL